MCNVKDIVKYITKSKAVEAQVNQCEKPICSNFYRIKLGTNLLFDRLSIIELTKPTQISISENRLRSICVIEVTEKQRAEL